MSINQQYREIIEDITAIHRSDIAVQVLLALADGNKSCSVVSREIGRKPSPVLKQLKRLENRELVMRDGELYLLSNTGRVLSRKIASCMSRSIELNGPGAPQDDSHTVPSTPYRMYMGFDRDIRSLFRSKMVLVILMSLIDGEKSAADLREITGSSSPNLRPRLRQLMHAGFITEEGYDYRLIPEGRVLAENIAECVRCAAVLNKFRRFWNTHSIKGIPEEALDLLGDLNDAVILGDTPTDTHLALEHFLSIVSAAGRLHGVSSWASTMVADVIAERVHAGIPVTLVVTPECARNLCSEAYIDKILPLEPYGHFQLRVTTLPVTVGLTVTDSHLSFGLFFRDGTTYDLIHDLNSTSPEALAWGERLFEYYRLHSVPMDEFLAQDGDWESSG